MICAISEEDTFNKISINYHQIVKYHGYIVLGVIENKDKSK